jgi:hypothetical protein
MYDILIRIPIVESSYDFQLLYKTDFSLYVKNLLIYLLKNNGSDVDNINIKFTDNLINVENSKFNLLIYFNDMDNIKDFKYISNHDYILINLNNKLSTFENLKKPLLTYYPNRYINYSIVKSPEKSVTIKLNDDVGIHLNHISNNIFSNLLFNKILINPYENNKLEKYNNTIKNIRYSNYNTIYRKYIELYNSKKSTNIYQYIRKFMMYFDIDNVNKLKSLKSKEHYVEIEQLTDNKHFIKISDHNESINHKIILLNNEIKKLYDDIDNEKSNLNINNLSSIISKKEESMEELKSLILKNINDFSDNALFNDNLDNFDFWTYKNYNKRQSIFKQFKYILLSDNYKSNVPLINKIIEVYLSGAIPLINKPNKYINNPIIFDDNIFEKMYINYSYEHLLYISPITCKRTNISPEECFNNILNKHDNFELNFLSSELLSSLPDYLQIDKYFDNLVSVLQNHIASQQLQ